jgi:hypothetical protein
MCCIRVRSDNCLLLLPLSAADEPAFGSRDDKLVGCKLQRRAWDLNTELMTPIFTAIREPLSKDRRMRGEHGTLYAKQKETIVRKRDELHDIKEELDAQQALEEAAGSAIAEASRSVLSPA